MGARGTGAQQIHGLIARQAGVECEMCRQIGARGGRLGPEDRGASGSLTGPGGRGLRIVLVRLVIGRGVVIIVVIRPLTRCPAPRRLAVARFAVIVIIGAPGPAPIGAIFVIVPSVIVRAPGAATPRSGIIVVVIGCAVAAIVVFVGVDAIVILFRATPAREGGGAQQMGERQRSPGTICH
ncbi:hypothetical protein HLH34_04400 [Gluconacetobacter azotocaptans]|uniref:Uncharacterized protein n=1 Tax=Gluconacetobacter azotocaptans TaxID=142834 RepID=A0A7W4JQS2_9PROT|nr:hypothetical protein [Gluconacetobacter azotocaptans]MBB2189205.1 hypothetical protein [Gluconacetobacter azotocaptans]